MSKLSQLNAASLDEFVLAVGSVYELSPHFAQRAAARRPFAKADDLRQALRAEVDEASEAEKLALIKAPWRVR